MRGLRCLAVLLMAAGCALAPARAADELQQNRSNTWSGSPDTWEGPWQEGGLELPALPAKSDLAQFFSFQLDPEYLYLLDRGSFSLDNDGVFRYTMVIRSPSGTVDVLYEGVRCETREYKTYAYLSGDAFQPVRDPRWREVTFQGGTAYRAALLHEIVCAEGGADFPDTMELIRAKVERSDREGERKIKVFRRNPKYDNKS